MDVRVDDKGELYGGLIIKTIRTDDWLLCHVHARITFYHPYIASLDDERAPLSMNRPDRKSFRIQPSRVPYLRSQLVGLSARIAAMVDRARRGDLWKLAMRRNPVFDYDSKRVRTAIFEIGMLSGGLAPLLWTMKSMAEAVAHAVDVAVRAVVAEAGAVNMEMTVMVVVVEKTPLLPVSVDMAVALNVGLRP